MGGLEQILAHIKEDAQETANDYIARARSKADLISESEKQETEAKEAAIKKQSENDISSAKKRIESAAELKEKRMILEAKQTEIDKVIKEALERIGSMQDSEYFDLVVKMAGKYAAPRDGEIRFSAKDNARLPSDLLDRINAQLSGKGKLTLNTEPAKISGGFILNYGDIEENCSLEAIVDASREQLQDKIGQILFG